MALLARTWLMLALLLPGPALPSDEQVPPGPFRESAVPLWDSRAEGVGQWIPDRELLDADGRGVRLSELVGDVPLVLAVRDPECPVGRRQVPTLAALQAHWEPNQARFVWLVPGMASTAPEFGAAVTALREGGLRGPVLADPSGVLLADLDARSSTEVFVLDGGRTLRYRGAIDDQHGIGFTRDVPSQTWLADALAALSADRRPRVGATTAPGCVLQLPVRQPAAEDDSPQAPTWHREISRLLQERCQDCHRSDGVAPFALQTLEQVRRKGAMIAYVIEHGLMPPWGAKAGPHAWINDRSLAESEREQLLAWLEDGAPEGDPADAPIPRRWPQGWSAGEPDLVIEGPVIDVPASGTVPYQYFYVRSGLEQDRWIEALEVQPQASRVVHHVLVFVEDPPAGYDGRVLTRGDGGLHGYFAGYIPGQGARGFGPGRGKRLPAHSWLKFQVHYTTDGAPTTDRVRLGLHFADGPPRVELKTSGVSNTELVIPPGAAHYEATAEGTFSQAAVLAAFSPHMHLRGKAFRYELTRPDGSTDTLLDIPAYDFNWQTMYELAEPLEVPAGSRLRVTAWYDNSAANPANPDPSAKVRFGEQTWDEMLIGYFEWWLAGAAPESAAESR